MASCGDFSDKSPLTPMWGMTLLIRPIARSDLFARRHGLMEQWAVYLSQTDDKVVPLVRRG